MSIYQFHVEVNMPERYKAPIYEGPLKYRRHAREEAQMDRYGSIPLPAVFDASKAQLIEVDFDTDVDKVVKQLWRQPLDDKRDIVMAIMEDGFVRTVWVNLRTDKHRTLNRAKYVRA